MKDILGSGGGGKGGGGGSARTPVESPDSLHNTAYAAVLDVIANGETAGPAHPNNPMRDIYLNGTPIQNPDGTMNFSNVQVDYRVGTSDQTHIPGFPASANVTQVGVEIRTDTPWVQTLTNPNLSAVRVSVHVPNLLRIIEDGGNAGDRVGYRVDYAIDLSVGGGAFAQVEAASFNGKTINGYTRTHRVELPASATGWAVRVRRLTQHSNNSMINDKIYLQAYAEVIDGKFTYPMTALVGIRINAEQFQSIPTRAYHWRGQIIRVPSNYDPVARTYSGTWDGTFKRAWSNNPAWVYYDMLTNRLYGLGERINAAMIDRYALYQIGAYCDQLVPDGMGGQEPRFVCNVYLQANADALRILNDLSSVFRGMAYWANGQVVAVADMPSDPVYTYTNANVIDGRFEYTGADLSTLKTAALVSWNDPTDFYRAKVEVVEDGDGIRRYGIRKTQIVAFGCTSRGQAQRVGLYHLYTSRMETGGLTFSVGLDGVIPQPGSLVKIADRNRAGRHIGGRIVTSSSNRKSITLDRDHPVKVGDTLTVNLPNGATQSRPVTALTGARIVTVSPAFTLKPAPESVWAVDAADLVTQHARVIAVKERDGITFDVSAVLHHPGKFAAIDSNVRLDPLPVSVAPPRAQLAPSNIQIIPHHVISQGIARHAVEITWDAPEHAVLYDVQWRRDNGDWVQMPRTGVRTLELSDVFSGTYLVRVRAVNSLDVPSLWAYSAATEVSGTAGTPPVLASLTATGEVMAIRLNWSYPNTPNIIERVQIRASLTNNFADSYALTEVAYPSNTYTVQGLGYSTQMWFWARLIDKNGEAGAWFPDAADAGIFGQPDQDAGNILDYLNGKLNESQFAPGLIEGISDATFAELLNTNPLIENLADISTTAETALSASGANATQIQTVQAQLQGDISAVNTKADAAVSASGANANQITTLGAQVNNVQSSVQQTSTALANLKTGAEATWGVNTQVRYDGRVVNTGVKLGAAIGANGQARSEFLVRADTVAFLNTVNGQLHSPFVFDTWNDTAFLRSAFIQNGSITNAKIGYAAIDSAKIASSAVNSAKIANGAITNAKIGNAAITTAKIGVAEIDTLRLKNNSVTVHSSATTYKGWGYYTPVLTCVLTVNQPSEAFIFIHVIHYLSPNNVGVCEYDVHINNGFFKKIQFTPPVGEQGFWGGISGSNNTYIFKCQLVSGSNTVKIFRPSGTGNYYEKFDMSMLLMAAMR